MILDLNAALEAEIEQRVAQRVEKILLGQQPPPARWNLDQPWWYGHVRRRFGWPRWAKLDWQRQMFLTTLVGNVLAHHNHHLLNRLEFIWAFMEQANKDIRGSGCKCAPMIDEAMAALQSVKGALGGQ